MILTLFTILLLLSLILIVTGRFIDAPALQLTGYSFLFLLGIVILFGALEYKTGEVMITTPVYAAGCPSAFPTCGFGCGQECITPETYVVNNTIVTTDTYTAFQNEIYSGVNLNHIIGFFICLIGALGFVIVLMNLDKFQHNPENGR